MPERICRAEGCSRPVYSRGLCQKCYNHAHRAGKLLPKDKDPEDSQVLEQAKGYEPSKLSRDDLLRACACQYAKVYELHALATGETRIKLGKRMKEITGYVEQLGEDEAFLKRNLPTCNPHLAKKSEEEALEAFDIFRGAR